MAERVERNSAHQFETLSKMVIGACIDVQRHLGLHCMEIDYQRALEIALRQQGLGQHREVEIAIRYQGEVVTKRRVDFVVWDEQSELILETKARSSILPEDVEQCLLVNFSQKPVGVRRFMNTGRDGLDRGALDRDRRESSR